ncbi:MAG: hypothetical protein ACP5MD_00375 [Verrucomicrobiia bacterium]
MIIARSQVGSVVRLPGRASWFFRVNALAVLITVCLSALPVCVAGDLHMQVQLVWGTDGAPPAGSKYQPLEPQFKNKLARVFKWKNYFLIHEQKVVIAGQDDEKRLKLSSKCEIELKRIDDATLQIKLFGEGRWTKTVRQSVKALEKGELAVLAGDDKDNYADAWFVVISVPKR